MIVRLRCLALALACLAVPATGWSQPFAYALNPGSTRLMCSARHCVGPSLDVIDLATGHILNSTSMQTDGSPRAWRCRLMACRSTRPWRPADHFSGSLVTFDAVTLQVRGMVAVGQAPAGIALLLDWQMRLRREHGQ